MIIVRVQDQAERMASLTEYHKFLRALPHQDDDDDGSVQPPEVLELLPRVQLLERTMQLQAQDLVYARRAFARDVLELQDALDAKTEEVARLSDALQDAQADVAAAMEATEAAEAAEAAATAAAAAGGSAGAGGSGGAGGAAPDDGGGDGDATEAAKWQHHVDDDTQRSYYFNSETGDTTWERPACLPSMLRKEPLLTATKRLGGRLDDCVKDTVRHVLEAGTVDGFQEQAVALREAQDKAVALFAADLGLR